MALLRKYLFIGGDDIDPSGSFVYDSSVHRSFSVTVSTVCRSRMPLCNSLISLIDSIGARMLASRPSVGSRLLRANRVRHLDVRHRKTVQLNATTRVDVVHHLFTIVNVRPINCCSLTPTNIPMRSATFHTLSSRSLRGDPFHIFASLLHLSLVTSRALRRRTATALTRHRVFAANIVRLVRIFRTRNNLAARRTRRFIRRTLRAFH